MAKYIYKIDEDNKIGSLKTIESLHPFVGKISERFKNYNIYYVRVCTQSKEFNYGTNSTIGKQLYKEYVAAGVYIPRSTALDCIDIGDIL
jgi:hypothetical protein